MSQHDRNPLLEEAVKPPRFHAIEARHVAEGIPVLLDEVARGLEALESEGEPSWPGVVEPLERLHDRLGYGWGIAEHLMSVKNSDELRRAHESVEPQVVKLAMRMGQSRPIYDLLLGLRDGPAARALDSAQRRVVDKLIQEAELSGVGLDGEERERFQAVKLELAECSTRFGNHLLDATKAFHLDLTAPDQVAGLPASYLELAAMAAREGGVDGATAAEGPFRVSLDGPSYLGFMKNARNRDLRETVYRAYVSRASDGELDNGPLIERILALRREEARLLGFGTYAELSLSRKMAGTVERAYALIEELRAASRSAAEGDLDELRAFMRESGATEEADSIGPWDVTFWSERSREARYDYSEEELRSYFAFPDVLSGLFDLATRLFGIEVVAADGEVSVWHEDVRYFQVRGREDGALLASFFLDPYSRPAEKRGGAWMNELLGRSELFPDESGKPRRPVAYLVCNGSPPVDGKPSLMTFREIETLFHEFGHTLQHMLTRIDYGLASGIRNVEWDAVELPSQFMENWCYHHDTLVGLSRHVETGDRLPDALFEKIVAGRTFRSGSLMLRQLNFALLDLELHHRYQPGGDESPHDVQQRIAKEMAVLPPVPEDRFLCGFAHIFQGGYAAGYYSYKWAEVLSADAFGAFEEAGLSSDEALETTGRRFRDTVLGLGGSVPPMEVFKAFRGREPSTEALLRHSGLRSA